MAEGFELELSSSNATGLKGVHKTTGTGGKYTADVRMDGKQRSLGCFATPEEAALHYARLFGAQRELRQRRRSRRPKGRRACSRPMASTTRTIFGEVRHLGSFATSEDAASH